MTIVLDDIIELIGDLNEKIRIHMDKLSKNEALVRYSLIDPFLRSLGWDISDPTQLIPEFSTEVGRPDYALFIGNGDRPKAFLGAKKLGKSEDLNQYISYCVRKGVDYFIATDGQKWEVYDTFKRAELTEKKVVEWDISVEDPSQVATKALSIANLYAFGMLSKPSPFSRDTGQVDINAGADKSMSGIVSKKSSSRKNGKRSRPKMVIVNGEKFEINKANQILIRTAEWLISEGKITKQNVPIESGSHRWLISREPIHKTKRKFFNPYRLSNGLFLELHYGSEMIMHIARKLMKRFGYPHDSLVVEWE